MRVVLNRWPGAVTLPSVQADLNYLHSREDGTARLTAHTAFEQPGQSPNAVPRRSIELRALVFWPADRRH